MFEHSKLRRPSHSVDVSLALSGEILCHMCRRTVLVVKSHFCWRLDPQIDVLLRLLQLDRLFKVGNFIKCVRWSDQFHPRDLLDRDACGLWGETAGLREPVHLFC